MEKTGAWYSYDGQRLGQGKDNVRQMLKQNTALSQELEEKIRAALMPKVEEGQKEHAETAG